MKKIFTLFAASLVLLSAQAVQIDRSAVQLKTGKLNISAVNSNGVHQVNPSGTNFVMSVSDVTPAAFTVSVSPVNDAIIYYYDISEASYWEDSYTADVIAGSMKGSFDMYIAQYAQLGYELTYAYFLSEGADTYSFDNLKPDTEYIVWAMGMDGETCAATTDIDTLHVKTLPGEMSTNVITMAHNNGKLTISTTNNDPYFFIMESLEEYQKYEPDFSQASLAEEIQAWISSIANQGYMTYFMHAGNEEIDVYDFYTTYIAATMPTGDYVAMAAGYNQYVNTEVAYVQFSYVDTAVEDVKADTKAVKSLRDGQLVIERNGVRYNAQGVELK